MQNKNEIDWGKTVNEDEIDNALDPLRGVTALLGALELAREGGSHKYDKNAYFASGIVCRHVINDFEEMKPKVDYMDSKMREGK